MDESGTVRRQKVVLVVCVDVCHLDTQPPLTTQSQKASFSWLQTLLQKFLLYTTENIIPIDYVSMSVGHLVHVLLTVYNSTQDPTNSATLGTR